MKILADGTIAKVNTIVFVLNTNTVTRITHVNNRTKNFLTCEGLLNSPKIIGKILLRRATPEQKKLYWAQKEIVPLLLSKDGNRHKKSIKIVRKKTNMSITNCIEFVNNTMEKIKA